MRDELTRRHLLKLAGAGAVSLTVIPGVRPCGTEVTDVAGCGISPKVSWTDDGEKVLRPTLSYDDQVLWTTLMRVKDKLTSPLDDWYLWHWTHDGSVCRLYSAPSPRGPYTEHPTTLPSAPANFLPNVAAADVVWDPITEGFYATPECVGTLQAATPGLCTFLLHSFDGSSWTYAKRDPILMPRGSTNRWDNTGTSYCRFLRSFSGNLIRVAGKAILYYRAERNQKSNSGLVATYTVGAATSRNLLDWAPVTDARPLFNPMNGALHNLGSALCKDPDGYYNLVLSVRRPDSARLLMYVKRARVPNDPFSWDDGPGRLVYDPSEIGNLGSDGGSYAVDPADGKHFMTIGTGTPRSRFVGRAVRLLTPR
jgi:hypothetical protein